MDAQRPLYGLLAEFDSVSTLVDAAHRVHDEGYRRVDAFTPYPIHELFDALAAHDHRVQFFVLCGGIAGAFAGFGLCYWTQVIAYPLNVGGRPFNSWPSFIPVTFEVTILFAAITAVLSWIGLSGLPMPYHPVFNAQRFRERASTDGLFLAIEAQDAKFDRDKTRAFLQSVGARQIVEVEP